VGRTPRLRENTILGKKKGKKIEIVLVIEEVTGRIGGRSLKAPLPNTQGGTLTVPRRSRGCSKAPGGGGIKGGARYKNLNYKTRR